MDNGTIGVLNVGAGDITLSFDKSNPAERIRAARIVRDMLKRGYAILVKTGADAEGKATYQRIQDFDEDTCEYIIADYDPDSGRPSTGKRAARGTKRIEAAATTGVAVGRTAGG